MKTSTDNKKYTPLPKKKKNGSAYISMYRHKLSMATSQEQYNEHKFYKRAGHQQQILVENLFSCSNLS